MDFKEKVNRWKQLFQTDRQQAETFYYGNIFEEIIENFLSKSKALRRYRFLISLLGYSLQPIILFVKPIKFENGLIFLSRFSRVTLWSLRLALTSYSIRHRIS